jgi:uncharacterized membrane protein
MEYLLPAAVPLLLLGADLRRVVRATGDLLKAFLIGSGIDQFFITVLLANNLIAPACRSFRASQDASFIPH